MSNEILNNLQLSTTSSDLLTNEERELHNKVLNTFESIAEKSTGMPIKTVIDITAEELDIEPLDVSKILDAHYAEEDAKDVVES